MQLNQGNLLYEYAIIRFVPKVERGEFFNIGLIMMCKSRKWIRCQYHVHQQRYCVFKSDISFQHLSRHLDFFVNLANGDKRLSQLAELPVEERFRWLTAVKSSCIQTSEVHPGLTSDLDKTFDNLYTELVL